MLVWTGEISLKSYQVSCRLILNTANQLLLIVRAQLQLETLNFLSASVCRVRLLNFSIVGEALICWWGTAAGCSPVEQLLSKMGCQRVT